MKKNYQRGFTLIELLVVIAIIGILASVVLASLNSARNKGADAAVKASMSNARAQAELFYDSNTGSTSDSDGSASTTGYAGVCGAGSNTAGVQAILAGAARQSADSDGALSDDAATTLTAGTCNDSTSAWAAEIPLKTGGYYCVDSTGKAQQNTSAGLDSGTNYDC